MVICLAIGAIGGAFNAFMITYVGIPSLVVTLAMLIGFRGFARVLLEDQGLGNFPQWVNDLGQKAFLGPLPLALVIFVVLLLVCGVVLHRTGFGREVFVIGNNAEVARYSGVRVARVKSILFIASGIVSALAGLLYAARLASVRGDAATGFELDIITMVLLGGVSIFGGKGTMVGVLLSILVVLNLRNGMALTNITGHIQTGVIGMSADHLGARPQSGAANAGAGRVAFRPLSGEGRGPKPTHPSPSGTAPLRVRCCSGRSTRARRRAGPVASECCRCSGQPCGCGCGCPVR